MASFIPNLHHNSSQSNKLNKTTTVTTTPLSFRSNQWTTQQKHQIYASKLIQALHHSPPTSSSSVAAKQVRQTADRVLAVTTNATMRWSRAILTGPQSAGSKIMKKHKKVKADIAARRFRKLAVNKDKRKLTIVERKLKVLGRIVPGCGRKLSYSNILNETSDYIAALEMQVRAMTTITEFLAGGGSVEAQAPADRLGSNVQS